MGISSASSSPLVGPICLKSELLASKQLFSHLIFLKMSDFVWIVLNFAYKWLIWLTNSECLKNCLGLTERSLCMVEQTCVMFGFSTLAGAQICITPASSLLKLRDSDQDPPFLFIVVHSFNLFKILKTIRGNYLNRRTTPQACTCVFCLIQLSLCFLIILY